MLRISTGSSHHIGMYCVSFIALVSFFFFSGCYLVRRHSKLIILLLERIRAHNTVHPIKRIDTKWQMLQHSCVPHNCSAPPSATRDMWVWFHLQHLTLFTLVVFEQAQVIRSRRRSTRNPPSTCRFVRMVYVYLLVIKSIDSLVPFCHALMIPWSTFTATPKLNFDGRLFPILKWFIQTCHSFNHFPFAFLRLVPTVERPRSGMSSTLKVAHILVFMYGIKSANWLWAVNRRREMPTKFKTYIVRDEYNLLRRPV